MMFDLNIIKRKYQDIVAIEALLERTSEEPVYEYLMVEWSSDKKVKERIRFEVDDTNFVYELLPYVMGGGCEDRMFLDTLNRCNQENRPLREYNRLYGSVGRADVEEIVVYKECTATSLQTISAKRANQRAWIALGVSVAAVLLAILF